MRGVPRRPFADLEGRRYVLLTTFRKNGQPVPTPVWFSLGTGHDRVRVFTDIESGKARRIRNDPSVTLAPCDVRGRPDGDVVRAGARILGEAEGAAVDRELREKYGWQYRAFRLLLRLLGKASREAYLEMRPATGEVPETGSSRGRTSRYSVLTVYDRNSIKSYLQRRRLRDALRVLDGLGEGFDGRFLDFGGGSGELTRILAGRFPAAEVICYEPMPDLLEEARRNLSGLENVVLVPSLGMLEGKRFRYVFCLEVFEHLPSRETTRAIRAIQRLLTREGTAVVGTPNELFLPALIKGLFRMTRRYGAFDARPANVLRAAVGRPPKRRPVREITPGLPYHFHHTGFDHRALRLRLSETFEVERQFASPAGGELLGMEIYLILKKRKDSRPRLGSASSR